MLADQREDAADEVAVAVGEVGVVASDHSVEAEAAVLAEGDLAEEEVAEDVGGEEVLLGPGGIGDGGEGGVFLELAGVVVLYAAQELVAEAGEDGFGADDVSF